MSQTIVHVAVGVITRENKIFLAKRNAKQHQGGKWEFPGGKVEAGETVLEALQRELNEECGINPNSSQELIVVEHDYGDKKVKLDTHIIQDFDGEAHGKEGQEVAWVEVTELDNIDFPAANIAIVDAVKAKIS
ncbi:8-oxo-dGTP diphosphatase MutT [Catenovulum maritimum]|uniref:8-oxo-dGTP diphosphatase n=1 Tax=Catenovulum maritimum TaxID=1513271 RepID=A0A0J8GRC7_9ALTE|nr:8-oxo-dGTP diphosphatase MutT [Catenovulum maritimum]KMT63804.1 7,8-dihydro-8-oxoguanine-triphosphatase [Catenovulum maritimum]